MVYYNQTVSSSYYYIDKYSNINSLFRKWKIFLLTKKLWNYLASDTAQCLETESKTHLSIDNCCHHFIKVHKNWSSEQE